MDKTLRSRLLAGLLVLAVVASLVTLYLVRSSALPDTETLRGGGTASTAPGDGDGGDDTGFRQVRLFLDGWSRASLGQQQASYRVGAVADAAGAETGQPVAWTPMSADEVRDLAESNPDLVTRVAARLVNAEQDMSCDADGCTSSSAEVSYEQIAEPSELPNLGSSYEGYGVTSGLWRAELNVPSASSSVEISAPGWLPATLSTDLLDATGEDEDGGEVTVEPSAENGYLSATYPLSAGLGRFFVTDPSWIGDGATTQERRDFLIGDPVASELEDATQAPLFGSGLGSPTVYSSGLSGSQLTYMTSPTTGCGVGVLCVPGSLDNQVEDFTASISQVCTESGGRALVLFQSGLWNVDLPSPTSIQGAWNGQSPEDFPGAGGASVVYAGQAPLVEGQQALRQSSAYLFDADGGVSLAAVAGTMAQEGFDSEEALARTLGEDQLDQLFDGLYSTC